MMSNPPPPSDDEQPPKPLPVIYPDADPHNANWLRILAQRRQQEQADNPKKQQQKETPDHDDVQ